MAKKSDLIFDDKNFNKGNEAGKALIEKSFKQFGAGRSILIDKNNRIIAGNKSAENFTGDDVQIIESDGTKLIAVKRTDIDLDTPMGREMALADNATAKANIVWAEDVISSELGVEVAEAWGVEMIGNTESEQNKKLSDRFIIPPFSVLDTKQGAWQQRKNYWLSLGIKSEIGRGGDDVQYSDGRNPKTYQNQSGLKKIMNEKKRS